MTTHHAFLVTIAVDDDADPVSLQNFVAEAVEMWEESDAHNYGVTSVQVSAPLGDWDMVIRYDDGPDDDTVRSIIGHIIGGHNGVRLDNGLTADIASATVEWLHPDVLGLRGHRVNEAGDEYGEVRIPLRDINELTIY